ncbi:MAG: DNA-binding Lrp family transcriptional regulator [Enterobacterales bacterium]|jgi:DNA-binding Lrp family transcriptional regulator
MINSRLDATDIAILCELQINGRIKNVELAEKISLSPSPCLQRVRRLEKIGLIEGYGAKIAIKQLTNTIVILTQFSLSIDTLENHHKFEQMIISCPEVMECLMGSGGFDYMVKFVCRNIEHYQDIIKSLLGTELEISKYTSYVVMKEVVSRTSYPIKSLLNSKTSS